MSGGRKVIWDGLGRVDKFASVVDCGSFWPELRFLASQSLNIARIEARDFVSKRSRDAVFEICHCGLVQCFLLGRDADQEARGGA